MQFSVVLWSVWGLLVLCFIIVKIYVMRLSRDEDDELVLREGFASLKEEQAAVMAHLHKAEPIQRTLLWAVSAISLIVVVYYVVDMVRQFQ